MSLFRFLSHKESPAFAHLSRATPGIFNSGLSTLPALFVSFGLSVPFVAFVAFVQFVAFVRFVRFVAGRPLPRVLFFPRGILRVSSTKMNSIFKPLQPVEKEMKY